MNVVVIVPFRPDGGHRDAVWSFLRWSFWEQLPYRLVVGRHTDGLFNRSAAINGAAVGAWDVAVIADADTWVPYPQLVDAVELASSTGRVCAAFDMVMELADFTTAYLLKGRTSLVDVDQFVADRIRVTDLEVQSSAIVVPRQVWDDVGGFDERFVGWGGEDNAFWRAATLLGGEPDRVSGMAYHLWHQSSDGKHAGPQYQKNLALWKRYQAATTVNELCAIR